jgi:hypothetical protein
MSPSSPDGGRIGILGRSLPNPQTLVNPTLSNLLAETDLQKAQLDTTLVVLSMPEEAGDLEPTRVEIGIRPAELND